MLGQKSMDYLDVGHTVFRRFCTHYLGSTQVGSTKHYLGNSRISMVKYSLHYHTLPRISMVKQPRFTMHSPWSVVLNLVKKVRETPRREPGTLRLGVLHPNHYTTLNLLLLLKQIKAKFNRH